MQAAARTGIFVLGPALVATLLHPAVAGAIVVGGMFFAAADIWGATIFPYSTHAHDGGRSTTGVAVIAE